MRIKIRIYNPYDLDIIALSEAPNFSVSNAMKQTLIYYAKGKRYLVEIPSLTDHLVNEQYVKGFYVELDDVVDAEAIKFIKSIPEGLRNSFMKNIFRASFEVSPLSLYMGDGGAEYVAKMIANPRYGRHPVQREIIDPVYLAEGEIGAIVSDTAPDVSKLPQGKKASSVKKKPKTEAETLRDLTNNAYRNSMEKEEDKKRRQKDALAMRDSAGVDADLDALLDTMM
jgi:hypothetical protein